MKTRLGVISRSERFIHRIRLLLREEYFVVEVTAENAHTLGKVIQDIDTTEPVDGTLWVGSGGVLPFPFRHEELTRLLAEGESDKRRLLRLAKGECAVYLGDEEIRLTDTEYRLMSLLMSKGGFVDRKTIRFAVFDDCAGDSAVNVYIHYLREKLEQRGEKIIISSRKEGYKIDEKYKEGASNA